ncbi:hypothetical protein [Nocardia sp. NPDC046763]|uniref:hypothetical protein n=1 Tax=Nocardia sp. NPDC046763 TaxID=3155256 RepID=UPI0033D6240A
MTATFQLGGDLTVRRIGYGATRLTGPQVPGFSNDMHDLAVHLAENVATGDLRLSDDQFRRLSTAG